MMLGTIEYRLFVSFIDFDVVSSNNLGENPVSVKIPTIKLVDYDTTLGQNMIVFGKLGSTSEHNKRIHGAKIVLKSSYPED